MIALRFRGIAYGFQTLCEATEVFYEMSGFDVPETARGMRWSDPRFAIPGAIEPTAMSEREGRLPDSDGSRCEDEPA